jgi:haloalkane dehalogenase
MPEILPTTPDDPASAANRTAWRALSRWPKPFLVAFSDLDPITGAMAPVLARTVPGARSVTIAGGGHFLQEDRGRDLAGAIAEFVSRDG